METILTITDLTRMSGQRVCVAGVNSDGRSIRLQLASGIMEAWLFEEGRVVIHPFTQVRFDILEPRPQPPHTEDYYVRPDCKQAVQTVLLYQRRQLLARILDPGVASIFGTDIQHDNGYFVASGSGSRSLGTIKVEGIVRVAYTLINNKWDYRFIFYDASHTCYPLQVTDLTFRYYVDDLRINKHLNVAEIGKQLTSTFKARDVFLRVGLARGWDRFPDRCYLQITGVYSFLYCAPKTGQIFGFPYVTTYYAATC
ncbi:MAG: dual OB domain-containing protein [Anaerolineae bacterium]